MDALYILGRGSKHDNLELRLSLRTLDANGKDIDKVFIVGNKPEWVKDVIHIPAEDTYQRMQNHASKVIKAIKNGISDDFLLMNDDFFMLKTFDAETYPYYVKGELEHADETRENFKTYQKVLNKTREYLLENGVKKPLAYNVHCPIRYNCKKFLKFEPLFEKVKFEDIGYSWRCLYGNTFIKKAQVVKDCKYFDDVWKESETGCISTSDNCDKILNELQNRYQNKSRWEK